MHDPLFVSKGDFHSMSELGGDVYDIDKDSWTGRHTNSFPEFSLDRNIFRHQGSFPELGLDKNCFWPYGALAADKLFATVGVSKRRNKFQRSVSLLRTRGYDHTGQEEIMWHETSCPRQVESICERAFAVLFPIKL